MPQKRKARAKPKSQRGAGILSTIAGKVSSLATSARNVARRAACGSRARPLFPGEHHAPCANFTGPGTRYDLKEVRDMKPYDSIDACSKIHDDDYWKIEKLPKEQRAAAVQEADRKALACYNKHKTSPTYAMAYAGIGGKYLVEKGLSAVKGTPTVLYGGRKKRKAKTPKRNAAGQFVKAT